MDITSRLKGLRNSHSFYSIQTNFVNQGLSLISFLVLPNILMPNEYDKVVFIGVILGFNVLFEFGLQFVYVKNIASYFDGKDCINEIGVSTINQTTFAVRLIGTLLFSLVIFTSYCLKFSFSPVAVMVAALPVTMLAVQFNLQVLTAKSDFYSFRNFSVLNRSSVVISSLAMAWCLGIFGWIVGTLSALILSMISMRSTLIFPSVIIDWNYVSANIKAAAFLLVNFFVWQQLLILGKVLATFVYVGEALSTIGILYSLYWAFASLIIAAYIPIGVYVHRHFKVSRGEVINRLYRRFVFSLPIVSLIVLLMCNMTVFNFVNAFFAMYDLDYDAYRTLMVSLVLFPFFIGFGNILVANHHEKYMLSISGIAMLVAMSVYCFDLADSLVDVNFTGVAVYAVLIQSYMARHFFHMIKSKALLLALIVVFIVLLYSGVFT